ncbi:MAG TPA: PaaI family thioesterase [Rhizomicrobium sp.]|nr:PaaI family thioesterase [Rhizomicrobium sp.]
MPATVFDRFPRPPCADHLGWTLLDHDAKAGWARLAFTARREFLNPAGFVQGGFVTAMLDDTMGPAVLLATEGRLYTVTLNLSVQFVAPARAGRFTGEGRIVSLGKTIAFLEAKLFDAEDVLVATATSSARLVPVEKLAA